MSALAASTTTRPGVRLDQHLLINDSGIVVCAKCGYEFGPASDNYKLKAVRKDRPIQEANPCIVDPHLFIDRDVVFRQFFCPGCATVLDNEVRVAESAPLWDKQIGR